MRVCTKHPHTNEAKARACYVKNVSKRADKLLQPLTWSKSTDLYRQVKCDPPEQQPGVAATVFVFFKGVPKYG